MSDADLKAVRDAGYTEANVIEIVALVSHVLADQFLQQRVRSGQRLRGAGAGRLDLEGSGDEACAV